MKLKKQVFFQIIFVFLIDLIALEIEDIFLFFVFFCS